MRIKSQKKRLAIYVILRVLVIITMIAQFFNGNYGNVFTCVLTLILFMMPTIIERKLNIDLPDTLEAIILLFIFAAEILGEIQEYYLVFDHWDDILHTTNGFLCAAIGFSLIDILNRSEKIHMTLSPKFVAMVAFCFSMTVGVLWEFAEFSMDLWFGTDTQKDTWITAFNTVNLHPDGSNIPVHVDATQVIVNGDVWQAYLDIGLIDTMNDLFVNFIGAVAFSIIGLVYIKNRGGKFIERILPTMKKEEEKEE